MKNKVIFFNNNVFDSIKHIDEFGIEYWYARELQKVLNYKEWRKFEGVIDKAKNACKNSDVDVNEQFVGADKLSINVNGGKRKILDYRLSRYACYLIAQNGDSRKEIIALAQSYFAIQTRKQELIENDYEALSENEKRLYRRKLTKDGNKALYKAARAKGVKNYDHFTNSGYRGLYNGETADDIAKRKKLRYREEILDNMGSAELAANIFRISQTEELLKVQKDANEQLANEIHYRVGKAIRKTIKELGGTMPEDLPTPKESIKVLEEQELKNIKGGFNYLIFN